MNATELTRNRIAYAFIICFVVIVGLASRHYSGNLPYFIATYAGDTLWALMVFLLIGFLFPSSSILKVATIALLFSCCIEFSQLYHAPWIDDIRQNRLAALVLGRGFLWSDLVCYSVGVAMGAMTELLWKKFLQN